MLYGTEIFRALKSYYETNMTVFVLSQWKNLDHKFSERRSGQTVHTITSLIRVFTVCYSIDLHFGGISRRNKVRI